MELEPLHMRHVTDVVPDYALLRGSADKSAVAYAKAVAETLAMQVDTADFPSRGTYLRVLRPREHPGVALKMFYPAENDPDLEEFRNLMVKHITSPTLLRVAQDQSLLYFANGIIPSTLKNLSFNEQILLIRAWEHRQHERLYAPYVLPSLFFSYQTPTDICASSPVSLFRQEHLQRKGLLSSDHKEILQKRGTMVGCMVQNFEPLKGSALRFRPDQLTRAERWQVRDFGRKLLSGYTHWGYTIDLGEFEHFENLQFTTSGRLILVDTNFLNRKHPIQDVYLKKITALSCYPVD